MTQKRLRKAAAYQPARTQGQTWDVLSRQGPSTQWDRLQREVLWVAMALWNQDITDWSPLQGLWCGTGVRSARFLCCFQTKPRAFPGSQQRSSRTRERNAFRDKLLGAALMAGPDHSCLGPRGSTLHSQTDARSSGKDSFTPWEDSGSGICFKTNSNNKKLRGGGGKPTDKFREMLTIAD